ncbi:MAG: hypothetical protein EBX42_12210 [Betaproteobacteria bacterium]|nr:hypothetical protein [Betaproteobacteria bacterium]
MRLTSTEFSAGTVLHDFDCDFTVVTAGDGLWGCEAGRQVRVTKITVTHTAFGEGDINTQVDVAHDSTWDIYTDTAFESAMQEDGVASMEV